LTFGLPIWVVGEWVLAVTLGRLSNKIDPSPGFTVRRIVILLPIAIAILALGVLLGPEGPELGGDGFWDAHFSDSW
jgi:hypothetical protein